MEPTCPNGHRSALERIEARRLSGVLVALGFTLLVVSLLGAGIGALMLFGGKVLERESAKTPDQTRQELQAEGVPEPLIASVLGENDAPIPPEQLNELTPRQIQAVQRAQLAKLSRKIDPEDLRSAALTLLAVGLVGAVVGWLLRAKKTVLQCVECGATAPT